MDDHRDPHAGLHSEQGPRAGEHPGRAADPIVKVHDLAWLEFQKPDLHRSERFARAFGFTTSARTADELVLRAPTAYEDVVRPAHVRLLDYEVEIGLVLGRDVPVGTEITDGHLSGYVAGLVVTNDVSAP